jgi:hypothetical protein
MGQGASLPGQSCIPVPASSTDGPAGGAGLELLGRAGMVADRAADLSSPAGSELGKDGRTALTVARPGPDPGLPGSRAGRPGPPPHSHRPRPAPRPEDQGPAELPARRAAPGHPHRPSPDQHLPAAGRLTPPFPPVNPRQPVEPTAVPERLRIPARPPTAITLRDTPARPSRPCPQTPITLFYMALRVRPLAVTGIWLWRE